MKISGFFVSIIITIALFACGGGGGGTSDTGTNSISSNDYTNHDIAKVYTFKETVVDTTNGNNTQSEYTLSYSYAQVGSIPGGYGYSGTISGPYILETVKLNDVDRLFTYFSPSSVIISDDFSVFTNIDNSSSTDGIPSDWTVGATYSTSTTEDLFSSANGLQVGTQTTDYTLKALGKENVTVTAGTFEAVNTQESSTVTKTFAGETEIITSMLTISYGKGVGFVRKVAHTTDEITTGSSTETSTNTITDELTNVSQ